MRVVVVVVAAYDDGDGGGGGGGGPGGGGVVDQQTEQVHAYTHTGRQADDTETVSTRSSSNGPDCTSIAAVITTKPHLPWHCRR